MAERDVTGPPDVPPHVRAYLVGVTDLYRTHDIETLVTDAITPDIEFIDHRPMGADPIVGSAAVRRWLQTIFELMPDWQIAVDVVAADGDVYLARDSYSGHGAQGFGAAETEWYVVDTLREGRLAREEIFADESSARAAFDRLRVAT